ncbi:MAG: 3-oxoacyl-ACP reductase FabG [Candidatus Caldatribacteriota bacterium]|nr:3-oxoacyl-ACP reductase FabG [Candidatus Caldatribacteriota bacterium]
MNNFNVDLQGEVAIVTGAGGIGAAIIKGLIRNGAFVIVGDIKLDKIKKEMGEDGFYKDKISFLQIDASDFSQVTEMINKTIKKYGKIDILLNTVGILRESSILETSKDEWDNTLHINLDSVFNLCKAVMPYMVRQKKGKIVNFTSIAGQRGSSLSVHYGSSKAGIIGFTKSLAKEVGCYGINVNAIAPGIIRSDMSKKKITTTTEKYLSQIPLHRFGEPEDVVGMVLLLVSHAGNYVTGQIININGGMG